MTKKELKAFILEGWEERREEYQAKRRKDKKEMENWKRKKALGLPIRKQSYVKF